LRVLVGVRNLHRPVSAPVDFDLADAVFLAVIDSLEGLVRLTRIARMAANDADQRAWSRRLSVLNEALEAVHADFRNNSSLATDVLFERLVSAGI